MRSATLNRTVNAALFSSTFRPVLKSLIQREVKRKLYSLKRDSLPSFTEKRFQWLSALIECISHNLNRRYIDKEVLMKGLSSFAGERFFIDRSERINQIQENYRQRYGEYPPLFVTLSPTQACNLQCVGCYACSDRKKRSFLSFNMVRRILRDLHDNMSSRFITISGGEPFMYRDKGKSLLDIFSEFSDVYFLVYTNGTLLDKKLCERLADLGNVTPSISIEGWEKETDDRRGRGTFKKILKGAENLRTAGVPFGFSSTITRNNVYSFLDKHIYKYLFDTCGATYLWMFHMMPVGRAADTLPLLINSKQRVELYHLWEHLLSEYKYCIADFWNSGPVVDGCVAYGRWNGYFYIDWDGKIMPCVFVPFYEETVYDIYKSGRSLGDALQAPLFQKGRAWQREYGFCNCNKQNILMPCSIRDHFQNFKNHILTDSAIPENQDAQHMIEDPEIEETLLRFEDELSRLTEKIWNEDYIQLTKS